MAKKKKIVCKPTRGKQYGQIFKEQATPFQSSSLRLQRDKGLRKTDDYLTADALPEVTSTTWRCKRKVEKGKAKTLRKCHVELAFIGKRLAKKLKVPTGAYLRLCTQWAGDAHLIPVKDHADALQKSKQICDCHKEKSRNQCATQFGTRYLERGPQSKKG